MKAPIDDWKREVDVLSKGLLASLDDCPSEMRDAQFLRLTPDDFGDKEAGEAFSQRRDQWLSSRLEEENADPVGRDLIDLIDGLWQPQVGLAAWSASCRH